jgi:hypothetical protein
MVEIAKMFYTNKSSFVDKWNLIHFLMFFVTWVLIYTSMFDLSVETELFIAQIASIVSILLWSNLFYWAQLFNSFSFFVLMTSETLWEIKNFMFLFILVLGLFANAFWIFD